MAEALQQKIGIIGAGKIGAAIARGMVRPGLALPAELGVEAPRSNLKLCDFADIGILALKPQVIDSVVKEIAKKVGKTKLIVSVAAGVPPPPPGKKIPHGGGPRG